MVCKHGSTFSCFWVWSFMGNFSPTANMPPDFLTIAGSHCSSQMLLWKHIWPVDLIPEFGEFILFFVLVEFWDTNVLDCWLCVFVNCNEISFVFFSQFAAEFLSKSQIALFYSVLLLSYLLLELIWYWKFASLFKLCFCWIGIWAASLVVCWLRMF